MVDLYIYKYVNTGAVPLGYFNYEGGQNDET